MLAKLSRMNSPGKSSNRPSTRVHKWFGIIAPPDPLTMSLGGSSGTARSHYRSSGEFKRGRGDRRVVHP